MEGARWVQQHILAATPRAPLRVYVVWFDAFEGDERSLVDTRLMADGRVTQFWDERKHVGQWYARTLTRPDDPEWVEWDAFFVYAPGGTWAEAGVRPVRWGRTVIGKREELRSALASLLQKRSEKGEREGRDRRRARLRACGAARLRDALMARILDPAARSRGG